MKVEVWLRETSQPIMFIDAKNAYTKGLLYCVYSEGKVTKFPLEHIFRVVESY